MQTLTEKILALLEKYELSAKEICIKLDLEAEREKEIYEILKRVSRIVKRKGKRLMMIPPRCKNCGFELSKANAKRCPKCKSERIEDARFTIR